MPTVILSIELTEEPKGELWVASIRELPGVHEDDRDPVQAIEKVKKTARRLLTKAKNHPEKMRGFIDASLYDASDLEFASPLAASRA